MGASQENPHIAGWKAQTGYAGEYTHNGTRWACDFYAVDDEDAKRKLESIKGSLVLLGRIDMKIKCD